MMKLLLLFLKMLLITTLCCMAISVFLSYVGIHNLIVNFVCGSLIGILVLRKYSHQMYKIMLEMSEGKTMNEENHKL